VGRGLCQVRSETRQLAYEGLLPIHLKGILIPLFHSSLELFLLTEGLGSNTT
jgi:hypothetical protein